MRRHPVLSTLILPALFMLASTAARGDVCNFQSSAIAGIAGVAGILTTDHFGQVTNFECEVTSRNFILETKALRDNVVEKSKTLKIKVPVEAGQSINHQKTIETCVGVWVSTTRSGYRFLGDTWDESDISGPFFMNCLPDDPPDPPPTCEAGYDDTVTWELVPGEGVRLAEIQLNRPLERFEERPEGSVFMDEWALLPSSDGPPTTFKVASSRTFAKRAMEATAGSRQPSRGVPTLAVQAARHADNARQAPVPTLAPFATQVREGFEGAFWFRAEVAEGGAVDRLIMLDSGNALVAREVRRALSGELRLEYPDHHRHRAVVFGFATLSTDGLLQVPDSLVVLPQCCCADEIFCL